VTLEELNLKVDDSTFTGRIAVEDFAKQSLRIQLKGDTFDADRYLPPKSAEANSAAVARQAEVQQRSRRHWPLRATRRCPTRRPKAAGAPPS
jgi:hypothetical protein